MAAAQEKAAEARAAEQKVKQSADELQAGITARMTDPFDDLSNDADGFAIMMAHKNAAVRKNMKNELIQHQTM